jgi:hypothetical protein
MYRIVPHKRLSIIILSIIITNCSLMQRILPLPTPTMTPTLSSTPTFTPTLSPTPTLTPTLSYTSILSNTSSSETQLFPISIDLVGTRWKIVYEAPSEGHREYELIFHENGRLENTHPNDKTPDNDTWELTRTEIILRFNDGYAIFRGKFKDYNTMFGIARNITGISWEWIAYREPG